MIYSRAQWGADERMRDASSLHYGEVHAGFVHHTVNANDYTRAEVPGILRSIYAYHTQSRGWSDVGYNYLVDRFGRIWEGRYGGIDRPVVGAHTLNYNDYAFAMSAIGNYDIRQPSAAVLQAYGSLFAWKLSLHGVDASSTRQWVGSRNFQAINGHRDAASTACPGRYLYAKIPLIRQYAEAAQRGWAGRELESDLTSTPHPDLIVRRPSDGQAFIIPTGGTSAFNRPTTVSAGWSGADSVVATPDVTGDGRADLLVRDADGTTRVVPGDGAGGFGTPVRPTAKFAGHDLITAVGDFNEDGTNDLLARSPATGRLDAFLGGGGGGFAVRRLSTVWGGFNALAGTGDLNRDGHVDLLARDTQGRLWLFPGSGTGHFLRRVQVPGSFGQYDVITGFGDFNRDGLADLMVRAKSSGYGYILPSRGNGTFGHALGPIPTLKNVTGLTGGGQLAGNAAPDLIGRSGDRLVLVRNSGTFDAGAPIATGVNLRNASVVLNAGDWDRDGRGDIIYRSKLERLAVPAPRRRRRTLRRADPDRQGLRLGRAAGRGRRHDRRRVAGPDGPALPRGHADLPRQRGQRPEVQLCRPQQDQRRPPGGHRPLRRRRRSRQPVPRGQQADALPGQRARRADVGRQDVRHRPEPVRLGDRHQRREPHRARRPGRPREDHGLPVALPGHHHRLPAALVPG